MTVEKALIVGWVAGSLSVAIPFFMVYLRQITGAVGRIRELEAEVKKLTKGKG